MRRCLAVLALCMGAGAAAGEEGITSLGGGIHYSKGDYGTGASTEILAIPFTARYERGLWIYRLAVPYLRVKDEAGVIPGLGAVGSAPAERRTTSGLGDVVASATYLAYYDKQSTLGLDLTGKIKLPTADESKGLGTGETDFILQGELYRTFERTTVFGGIAYYILGSSPAIPLDNVWGASIGASYRLDTTDSVGVSFDERERVSPSASPQRELTLFWSRKAAGERRLQVYLLLGLANGSPDRGAGLSFSLPF